jgi:uncharacterized protein
VTKTTWIGVAAAAALVLGMSANASAQAKGPAFDCAKADGTVQKLICSDEALAALDRKLDAAYKGAVAKAKGPMLNTLKAEQRGWIKGRDDCWKAKSSETWLTESWIVKDVRSCVDGQYQLRIAELQVMWQLVPSQPAVSYACNNNPANEVVVQFFQTTPPAGRFERGDQTVVGYQVKTASGARYEGRNLAFSNKGSDATVTWLGEELKCKAR